MKERGQARQDSDKKALLIGLIPERNIFRQMDRYEPLAEYLSDRTGLHIRLRILTRYGNIVDNFRTLDLDGAFFGSFTYTLAHARLGVVPLARPETSDDVSTYHGLIIVRKDSGIRDADDMKGKIFAFVDRATTAGYLLPLAFFKANGIDDYSSYLGETYFAGTHEDVIFDVLNKHADIGATKNTVYDDMTVKNERIADELDVITRSPDVPSNALAVRGDIDDTVMTALKKSLTNMHKDPDGRKVLKKLGAKRFIDTTTADYAPVYQYVEKIGLDLATYDYLND